MSSLFSELWMFLKAHKILVLVPMIVLALGIAAIAFIFARRSELAPMIYTTSTLGALPGYSAS